MFHISRKSEKFLDLKNISNECGHFAVKSELRILSLKSKFNANLFSSLNECAKCNYFTVIRNLAYTITIMSSSELVNKVVCK